MFIFNSKQKNLNTEELRAICMELPHVTEDIKWENHLCFCICEKMFLILGIDEVPVTASFKVTNDNFELLQIQEGFTPAPYLARHKWLRVSDINQITPQQWEVLTKEAYDIIKSKLPKSKLKSLFQ